MGKLDKSLGKFKKSKKSGLLLPEDIESAPGDFIWTAMQDSFDPETNTVRDLKIDDRELSRAENFYDFCTNVSGKAIKPPFARQLWISYHLMSEYCPRCTPPEYIHDVYDIPVDMDPADLVKKVVLLESGVCPKCGAGKSEMILSGELRDINQLAMIAGQRAGKSSFASTLNGYILHRMLKAPRMSSICRGIQDFTPLTFTFVGLTAGRAIRLLWNPFTEIVKASDWFKSYFELLDHYGRLHEKEYYKDQVLFYRFFTKNIDIYPMGPVKRTLRGDTRIAASIDELSWFPLKGTTSDAENEEGDPSEELEEREHANADEVYTSLDNSLMTVRTEVYTLYKKGINHIPTGYMLNISSPQSEKDKLMRLLRESDNPEALSLGVQLPTWEISPLYERNHPVIRSAYAKNPIRAARDFGATPPSLTASMFKSTLVEQMFIADRENSHSIDITSTNSDSEDDSVIKRTRATLNVVKLPTEMPPSCLSVDAGMTNNSFTVSVGHLKDSVHLNLMTLLEIIPKKGTQIDFPWMYLHVMKPLIETMNVRVFASDRWNSITTLQQAKDDFGDKLMCVQRTLVAKDFNAFRTSIEDQEMSFPALEKDVADIIKTVNYKREMIGTPASHLYLQFLTVKQKNGVFIKGDSYTDDILRSVAVMHSVLLNPKVRTFLDTFRTIGGEGKEGVTRAASFVGSRLR